MYYSVSDAVILGKSNFGFSHQEANIVESYKFHAVTNSAEFENKVLDAITHALNYTLLKLITVRNHVCFA